jgi:hypothetical protein
VQNRPFIDALRLRIGEIFGVAGCRDERRIDLPTELTGGAGDGDLLIANRAALMTPRQH